MQCETCNGKGEAIFSCCTGEVLYGDSDICPRCHEHCGEEECTDCDGTGEVKDDTELAPHVDLTFQADLLQDIQNGK